MTTFNDVLPASGIYHYVVTSVRDAHEGLSQMVTVTTPLLCAVAPSAFDLALTIAMVDTDTAWDGIYCYLSVNGGAYERIPAGDSNVLSPAFSNNRYYDLTSLPGQGRIDLTGQSPNSPVTLRGECVGRRGPTSESLGTFSINHLQPDWDGSLRSVSGGAFRFSYCLGSSIQLWPCTPNIPGTPPVTGIILENPIFGVFYFFPSPTNLHETASGVACGDLPDVSDQVHCRASAAVCAITGCQGGRETLFWDWSQTAGIPESSLTGYTVFRTIYDTHDGIQLSSTSWDVYRRSDGSLPKRTLLEDFDLLCSQRVEYRVQAKQGNRHSELSDPILYQTDTCVSGAYVMISFDTLDVGPVNDTGEQYLIPPVAPFDTEDYTIEVDGSIYSPIGQMLDQSFINYNTDPIGNQNYSRRITQGTYHWSDLVDYDYFPKTIIDPNRTITFGVMIQEVDFEITHTDIVNRTPWCISEMTLPPRSLNAWASMNETYTLTSGSAEATCTVTVHVVGSAIP